MVKKLAALAGAGAMLLSVAAPVLARNGGGRHHRGSEDVAIVDNMAMAEANTGGNTQDNYATAEKGGSNTAYAGSGSGNRNMTTGNARAKAKAVVVANTHISCDPCVDPDPCVCRHKDFADVGNTALAGASSGDNTQDDVAYAGKGHGHYADAGSGSGDRNMTTGDAKAKAKAWVVVNTHLSGGLP